MLSLSSVSQRKHNGQHGIKTKFQEYFCLETAGTANITVSEVQLSSSSPFKRAVYSLLVRQPGKSFHTFDTEQVRMRTLSKRLFLFYKHAYLIVYDLTSLSKL